MGMESFFVILLPANVSQGKNQYGSIIYTGKSQISSDKFIQFLINSVPSIKPDSDYPEKLVLNDIINIAIEKDENGDLKFLTLEATLFYFEEGIKFFYNLSSLIKQSFPVFLFHPALGNMKDIIFEDFKKSIMNFYREKYEIFISTFGKVENGTNVLPGKSFTKYLERIGKVK